MLLQGKNKNNNNNNINNNKAKTQRNWTEKVFARSSNMLFFSLEVN